MDQRSNIRVRFKFSIVTVFTFSFYSLIKFNYAGVPSFSTDIECYERIAVGKRLNKTEVSMNLTAATVRLCEQECERLMCQAFSFGISNGGNGTCELADKRPDLRPVLDLDYDLFYKNTRCLNRTSCFRRFAAGRSLIGKYVRKTMYCDSLRSCEEACAQEVEFNCEGFNFRFDRSGHEQSKCQLTDMPSTKLSVTSDFNADRDFDFYEKDRDAPRTCFFPFIEFRPWTGYGPQQGYGGYRPNYIPHQDPHVPAPPNGDGAYYHHRHPPERPQYPPLHHQGHHDHRPPGRVPPPNGRPYPASSGDTAVGNYDYNHIGGNNGDDRGPPQPPTWQWDYYPYRYGDRGYEYGFGGGRPAYGLGSGWGLPDECFVRTRTGFRLDRPIIVISMAVPNLYECEYRCVNERKFTCNVFSFRYSVSPSVPGDNCHLGERSYRSLDIYTDIIPDRDYDIYERNRNRRDGCQPKRYWGSDCFERIRSGLKLKNSVVKYAMKCSSLSECESACINIPFFTCRAFSYRYGPRTIGESDENCLLTDWPLPEMNIHKHFELDAECELYHRGSYGHGCEISRYPDRGAFDGGYLPPAMPDQLPPTELSEHYQPSNEIHGSMFLNRHPGGYLLPPNQPNGDYIRPEKLLPSYLPPVVDHYPDFPSSGTRIPRPPHLEKPHESGYLPPHKPPIGSFIPPDKHLIGYLPPNKTPPPTGGYLPPNKPSPGGFKHPHGINEGNGFHYNTGEKGQISGGYLPPQNKPLHPPGYDKHHLNGGYLPPPPKYPDYYFNRRPEDQYGVDYHYYNQKEKPVGSGYLPPPNTAFSSGSYGVGGAYRVPPTNQFCYVRYSSPARLLPPAIKTSLWVPSELECKKSCTRAREKTRFRCATLSYRDGQCELSDIEQRDLKPGYDYLQDKAFGMFTWDFDSAECYQPPPSGKPPLINDRPPWGGDRGVEGTWSHFTVNGLPCRVGTVCSRNPEVGVWTCPIDNGDWDYCCRSGHHCGFSDGYSYPWCYVGSADKDQWRPCSDSYYPYAHSGRKLHWPVAYLHKEGPPNVTLTPTARTFVNQYRPSIVETFLRSLVKEVENNSNETINNNNNNIEPIFEQVDLVQPPTLNNVTSSKSAMDKMWQWGQSTYNSTNETHHSNNNEITSPDRSSAIFNDDFKSSNTTKS